MECTVRFHDVPALRLHSGGDSGGFEKLFCLEAVLVIPLVHQTANEIVLATQMSRACSMIHFGETGFPPKWV